MGCYAMTPTDYSTFAPFFKKVIGDYHKNDPEYSEKHVNDWDASGVGEGGVLDLQKLGLAEELSMRVRVGTCRARSRRRVCRAPSARPRAPTAPPRTTCRRRR